MALIRDSKQFVKGFVLLITYLVVLFLMFQPIFGKGMNGKDRNGLEFSDEFFNELAKGSSFFIPEISKNVAVFNGKEMSFKSDMKKMTIPEGVKGKLKADQAPAMAVDMIKAAGFNAEIKDTTVVVNGDLGKLLAKVLADSETLFKVNDANYPQIDGLDGKVTLAIWWNLLNNSIKGLQKDKHLAEANVIDEVIKKGIEPAYNFAGIPATSVMGKAGILLAGLLIFYVVYTMWYGYAIFDMFAGIGLTMKKAKVKKEV